MRWQWKRLLKNSLIFLSILALLNEGVGLSPYFGSSFRNNRVSLSATIIRFISFYWFFAGARSFSIIHCCRSLSARSYNFTIVKLLANLINNHVLNRVFISSSHVYTIFQFTCHLHVSYFEIKLFWNESKRAECPFYFF